jgi:hypothetical protein
VIISLEYLRRLLPSTKLFKKVDGNILVLISSLVSKSSGWFLSAGVKLIQTLKVAAVVNVGIQIATLENALKAAKWSFALHLKTIHASTSTR